MTMCSYAICVQDIVAGIRQCRAFDGLLCISLMTRVMWRVPTVAICAVAIRHQLFRTTGGKLLRCRDNSKVRKAAHMSEALEPRPEARLLGEIPGLDAGT